MDNKLNRAEIAVIVAQYFSDSNFEYSRIESGSSNSTYRISVNGLAYVLSIFESKGSDHVAELTSILSQLEDCGIRSSRVIAAVDGRLHTTFNGKPILLKEYISGEELTLATVTVSVAADIGRELARLQGAGDFESRRGIQHYGLEIFEDIAAELPDGDFKDWYLREFQRLKADFPSDLPMGYVHSDVFPDNVIIENGQFKCLLDFEYLSHYPRVFDLACGIVGLAWRDAALNLDLATGLINGYQSERQLQSAEKKALHYFCQYIALFFAGWRYRQFNITIPNSERAEDYLDMIDIVEAFKSQLPEKLADFE
jgi:homoserine kinase type II